MPKLISLSLSQCPSFNTLHFPLQYTEYTEYTELPPGNTTNWKFTLSRIHAGDDFCNTLSFMIYDNCEMWDFGFLLLHGINLCFLETFVCTSFGSSSSRPFFTISFTFKHSMLSFLPFSNFLNLNFFYTFVKLFTFF